MAFLEESDKEHKRSQREHRIKILGEENRKKELPLHVPPDSHPIRASDIKGSCPRQVYYNRLAGERLEELHDHEGVAITATTNAAALYGTTVHTLLEKGAPTSRRSFNKAWKDAVAQDTPPGDDSTLEIKWKTGAHPFKLTGFHTKATDKERLDALFLRYLQLDRENYLWFWEQHSDWSEVETELVLTGNFRGAFIRTTADIVSYNPNIDERIVVDWKTGQASEPTQLATYAMMAEARYNLAPGTINRGMFVLTGAGVPDYKRGKLPDSWRPYKDERVIQEWELEEWRPIVQDRVDKLLKFERMGTWPPIYNMLCHNTCDHRFICPVGKAVQTIMSEKEDG